MTDFLKFLITAKKNTYSSGKKNLKKNLIDGVKNFSFEKEKFFYRDRYYGYNPFAGQEVVFYNKKPIWIMNYFGKCLNNDISANEIYALLKKVLKKTSINSPFRGPEFLQSKNFKYINKTKGRVDSFSGVEKIYYKNKLVYRLDYRGGFIDNKK